MKQTIEELRNHYKGRNFKNSNTVFFSEDESVCKYSTKTTTKMVFSTDTLDREKFIELLGTMKASGATSMIVYCEYATYHSSKAEIIINRD